MSSVDLFTGIHKAVRGMLFDLSTKVQNLDVENPHERTALIDDIHNVFSFLEEHGNHEDALIFPLAAAEEPALAAELDAQHKAHIVLAQRIEAEMTELMHAATTESRCEALAVLRRSIHEFVAGQLLHMNHEERAMLPATRRIGSDEQLTSVRGQIVGSIPPDRYLVWMRWMLPALTPQELADMIRGLASAPPQVLHMIEGVAVDVLPASRWEYVRELAGYSEEAAA